MRIAIICHPVMGGSGVVATELAKALACRGHDVHLLSSSLPFRYTDCLPQLHFHQVVPLDYPLFQYRPYESSLAGKIIELVHRGVEVFHVHYALPHAISAYLAQQALAQEGKSLSLITTLHGTDTLLAEQEPILQPIIRLSLEHSQFVTAVSHSLAHQSQQTFNLSQTPIVIPNFIDTTEFSPSRYCAKLRSHYATEDEILLVHASNFRPIKRPQFLLKLLEELREIGIPAKLLMIGDGPERPICEKITREKGLSEIVCFEGARTDIAAFLAIGDIFVLASKYESFGLAALEALSCGVPVVAPRVGGLPELLEGGGGILYEPHDLQGAVYAILRILENLPLLREKARANALLYATQSVVTQYENLYERARVSVESLGPL
ncbi:MAG: N-acetyl-alpha-D-glucosaminyl L-malate synthase BshA [Bacteroidia bacterium]|nr:N-acetyl-alpha-D-glucosaminyl L-malate synthase BshA [Bacteroidia bacterium]MDW8235015.1 N-acetyl-alpha-D-glucosaminyl L-malate synthase BshA [Bacteroidia bacterium]